MALRLRTIVRHLTPDRDYETNPVSPDAYRIALTDLEKGVYAYSGTVKSLIDRLNNTSYNVRINALRALLFLARNSPPKVCPLLQQYSTTLDRYASMYPVWLPSSPVPLPFESWRRSPGHSAQGKPGRPVSHTESVPQALTIVTTAPKVPMSHDAS